MKIAVLKETYADEPRVAISPETVKKYKKLGFEVSIQSGAGDGSAFPDKSFQDAGAVIEKTVAATLKDADCLLKVRAPQTGANSELKGLKTGAVIISQFPYDKEDSLLAEANKGSLSCIALERIPRITRAQSMDILSSQANLGGYRAVIEAVFEFGRALPMMMTAAGTVPPAKVLVVGAGVAGLQAIATAKRLGAVVSAFDVRAAAKEQVESLGAKFIDVEADEDSETAGGYAKESSEAYKKRQADKMAEAVAASDIVITTALIPGKPAPRLVTAPMVKSMKPGSVLVDMAVERGGNIEGSKDNKVVDINGVKLIGYSNLPGRLATESSTLFARNLYNLVTLIYDATKKSISLDLDDDIIKGALITHNGKTVHSDYTASVNPKTNTKPESKTAEKSSKPAAAKPKKEAKT